MTDKPLLTVEDLHVDFATPKGLVEAVRGVSFTLGREKLGIVGESGSGKSVTGRSILKLIRPPGRVRAKRLEFDGIDLLGADGHHRVERELGVLHDHGNALAADLAHGALVGA